MTRLLIYFLLLRRTVIFRKTKDVGECRKIHSYNILEIQK